MGNEFSVLECVCARDLTTCVKETEREREDVKEPLESVLC